MDDTTKKIAQTLAIGAIKKGLMWAGGIMAGHGIAMGFTPADYAVAAAGIVAAGWSFWTDFGKGIVLSQLDVWKAKSLAQAEKLRSAGIAPVTVSQIAAQSPTLTTADVTKAVAKMPPSVQANIAPLLLAAIALSFLLAPAPASAQAKLRVVPAAATDDTAPDTGKCPLIWDPLKLCGTLTGKPADDMQRVVKRIQGVGRDDMNYAILKAKAANTLAAGVRLQCLMAILAAKDAAEGVTIKDASGNLIPRPDPAFVTLLEDTAELIDGLAPGGPLMTQCAGAAQMFKTNTLAAINGIVTGAASLAAGGIALP